MSDYYVLITDAGAALQAAALANGTTVNLASFGIDDGNGAEITPDAAQTALVNQVYSGDISSLAVSTSDDSVLVAQCIVPATSGGYVIRGVGIFTDDGTLYAVGNFPDQSKPDADSGYAASLEILVNLAVSDTSAITLTVVAADALTEAQADQLYLRQDQYLNEISLAGSSAQSVARTHLGLGDIATQRIANFLQVANYLSEIAEVGSDAQLAACANIAALALSGGALTGPLSSTSTISNTNEIQSAPTAGNSYRLICGDYGTFWRMDSNSLYLMLTAQGDTTGSFNSLRPFTVSLSNGAVNIDTPFTLAGLPITTLNGGGYWVDNVSGFIIQWGVGNTGSASAGTQSFNIEFPTASLAVMATIQTNINAGNTIYTDLANNQGFSFKGSAALMGFSYIAIGY